MRINFTAINNPAPLAIPAYAVGDETGDVEAIAAAIGRRNRGHAVIAGSETHECGGAGRHRINVVRDSGEVIGSVVVEVRR